MNTISLRIPMSNIIGVLSLAQRHFFWHFVTNLRQFDSLFSVLYNTHSSPLYLPSPANNLVFRLCKAVLKDLLLLFHKYKILIGFCVLKHCICISICQLCVSFCDVILGKLYPPPPPLPTSSHPP